MLRVLTTLIRDRAPSLKLALYFTLVPLIPIEGFDISNRIASTPTESFLGIGCNVILGLQMLLTGLVFYALERD